MAIRVNLDVTARRKTRLGELSEAVGISMTNLSVLKTGKARTIRFATLDALCAALDRYSPTISSNPTPRARNLTRNDEFCEQRKIEDLKRSICIEASTPHASPLDYL